MKYILESRIKASLKLWKNVPIKLSEGKRNILCERNLKHPTMFEHCVCIYLPSPSNMNIRWYNIICFKQSTADLSLVFTFFLECLPYQN